MANQEVPALCVTATLGPVKTDKNSRGWHSLIRIDRDLTSAEVADLQDIALDVVGVSGLELVTEVQKFRIHTLLCLECHSVADERQAEQVASRFVALANKVLNPVIPTFSHAARHVTV